MSLIEFTWLFILIFKLVFNNLFVVLTGFFAFVIGFGFDFLNFFNGLTSFFPLNFGYPTYPTDLFILLVF